MDEGQQPLVSVVIATYNYSSVLKYAIQSVLWQTFQNFEIWVIGDACTDDSEAVVQSFADSRVHWVNLPQNSGSQSIPNNEGISRARGKYIAYLGHDDLWHPTHLEVLVNALENSGAAAGHTLLLMNQPQDPRHAIYGLASSEKVHPFIVVPPSSLMHLRVLVEQTGLWRDYRTLRIPPDIDFVGRIAHSEKLFIPVMELTVFKFPSARRKNVYVEQPSHEQADYAERILHDPDFRYRELMAVIGEWATVRQALEFTFTPISLNPGEAVESWRTYRGLAPQAPMEALPILEDMYALIQCNPPGDITPEASRQYLYEQVKLPKNGVLLSGGWYGLERTAEGHAFRWLNTDAEIVLTDLDAGMWHLKMNVRRGFANGRWPVRLALVDAHDKVLGWKIIWRSGQVSFRIVSSGGTAVYRLRTLNSRNQPLPHDPRVLNVSVSDLRLEAGEVKLG